MTETSPATRVDPFPFQHRVGELMNAVARTLGPGAPVAAAVEALMQGPASAVVVVDDSGRPVGIVTERDVVCRVTGGGVPMTAAVTAVMNAPVATVPVDAFLYVAIARMSRLGFRHLAAVAPDGSYAGLLDARAVLRQRAMVALAIADEVAQAADWQGLKAAFARLPELGRSLRAEGVPAYQVAAVISGIIRDMTARCGELAQADMRAERRGEMPAPWCLLVLGSAGRGESLLSADQDNALIHGGAEDDYPWFQEFGERVAQTLNLAGLPFCRGGVMASKRNLRHNLSGWQESITTWFERPEPRAILNADIFYDFATAGGEPMLASALSDFSMRARNARLFLNLMAKAISEKEDALGWFGRFKTQQGRIDLKIGGLVPIVAGARVLALRLGCAERSSRERWRAAREAGILGEEDLACLLDAHEMILGLILDQQLADLGNGLPATSQVEVRRLLDLEQNRLKAALQVVRQIDLIVKNALGEALVRRLDERAASGRPATPEG